MLYNEIAINMEFFWKTTIIFCTYLPVPLLFGATSPGANLTANLTLPSTSTYNISDPIFTTIDDNHTSSYEGNGYTNVTTIPMISSTDTVEKRSTHTLSDKGNDNTTVTTIPLTSSGHAVENGSTHTPSDQGNVRKNFTEIPMTSIEGMLQNGSTQVISSSMGTPSIEPSTRKTTPSVEDEASSQGTTISTTLLTSGTQMQTAVTSYQSSIDPDNQFSTTGNEPGTSQETRTTSRLTSKSSSNDETNSTSMTTVSNAGSITAAVIFILLIFSMLIVVVILCKQGKIRPWNRIPTDHENRPTATKRLRDISQAASHRVSRMYTSLFRDRTRQRRPRLEIEVIRTSLRKAESPRSAIRGVSSLHSSMPILSLPDDQKSGTNNSSHPITKSASIDLSKIDNQEGVPRSNAKGEEKSKTLPSYSNRSSVPIPSVDQDRSKRWSQEEKKKYPGHPPPSGHVWSLSKPSNTKNSEAIDKKKKDNDEPMVVYVKDENQEKGTIDIKLAASSTNEAVSRKPSQTPTKEGASGFYRGSLPTRLSLLFTGIGSSNKRASMQKVSALSTGPPKPKRGKCQSECLADKGTLGFIDADALQESKGSGGAPKADEVVEM